MSSYSFNVSKASHRQVFLECIPIKTVVMNALRCVRRVEYSQLLVEVGNAKYTTGQKHIMESP